MRPDAATPGRIPRPTPDRAGGQGVDGAGLIGIETVEVAQRVRRALAVSAPEVSIIVPALREAQSIPELVRRIDDTMGAARLGYDVTVVNDYSGDGTDALCRELARRLPLRLVERWGERGLATAVLAGITASSGHHVVVMDADLSHPPEAIPRLLAPLIAGEADFVVGSRYVAGSTIDVEWTLSRRMTSSLASMLVAPLTSLADPLAGFFACRRVDLPETATLSPLGFKIGLELLVRGSFPRVVEVPIHFAERAHGESKLTLRESLLFLAHVARLLRYRYLPR